MTRWYPPAELPDAHPHALGVLELDEPPLELELHRERGRTRAVWRDERGRVLRRVVVALA